MFNFLYKTNRSKNVFSNFFVYRNNQVFLMLDMMTWQKIRVRPDFIFSRQCTLEQLDSDSIPIVLMKYVFISDWAPRGGIKMKYDVWRVWPINNCTNVESMITMQSWIKICPNGGQASFSIQCGFLKIFPFAKDF